MRIWCATVTQRMRWARGMAQILRLDCPLFKRGLSLPQRLNYFNAMAHFFFGIPRLIMILGPLSYLLFGIHPLRADVPAVLAYNKILYREMAFDPDKDLDPICLYAFQPNVLVVNPALPVKSVAELIAYAKAHPHQLNYASGGVGSTSHVAGELFKTMAGLEWQHVPYRGTGPSLVDLLAGQVQLTIDNLPAILPHIKSGALRALAISTDKRVPQLPDLPTIAESGLPGYAAISWQMVAAPSGTPRPILDRLAGTISKLTAEPAFRARVAEAGAEAAGGTVDEARAFVKEETVKWREVVLKSGAKAD